VKSPGAKGFDETSKKLALLLRSHIEIAKRVEGCLSHARATSRTLAAGLDRFTFAAFVLATDGEILHLNQAAMALLARDRRFRVRHGRLQLSDRDAQHRLETGLKRATPLRGYVALIRAIDRFTEWSFWSNSDPSLRYAGLGQKRSLDHFARLQQH
jgi:hypothetical protein